MASVAGLDQGQSTGLGLPTESGSLAAFVGAFVLVGTGEHGSQNHGKEVAPEDGASEFPVGALGTLSVAGMVTMPIILKEAMSVIMIVLLCMHVLVSVVIVVVVSILRSIEHGDLAAADKEAGFGEDEEDTRGEQSTGGKGRDAQRNELAGTVAMAGVGGGGFLPTADLAAEHRGDQEDDTGEGSDIDKKCGQDDLLPWLAVPSEELAFMALAVLDENSASSSSWA